MVLSFTCFLIAFILIGVSSALKSRGAGKDYYIASGSMKPWLVGLSALAAYRVATSLSK